MRQPSRPHESPLMRLVQIASALGASKVADEAFELADRVADGRFFCACVGQYKRGKSTFLNALIGEPILPVGVVPVTSAITVILHGKRRSARVRFQDGNVLQIAPGELRDYVAEEENPGNAKQVALIELFWPSPLLATGLCLVDTPGVGSIYAWNTEVTKTFVPQVDAALVLLGADPPLSELELELVDQFARQTTTLLFALNKADRMAPSEISEAREFTQRALATRLAKTDLRIYEVSATERLLRGPSRDWSELEAELAYLAQSSAQALVQRAQQRGVERFAGALKHEVAVRLEALHKPLHEQDAKLEAAETEIAQAERSIPMLFLENAEDQLRMDSDLERRREAFLKAAVPRGKLELEKAMAGVQAKGPALQAGGVQASRKIALTLLDVWSKELARLIEANFREVVERMMPYAHDFVRKVSPSSMAAFKELRKAVDVTAGPALPPALAEPTFRPSKIPEAVLWTEAGVKAQIEELAGYLRRLVDTSSILMSRQARERYREKQRTLEADLRAWMGDVASLATRALERSRDMHRAGSEAVRAETERLRLLPQELDALVTVQAHRTAAAVSAPAVPRFEGAEPRGPGGAVGMPHDAAVRVGPVPVGQQVTQPMPVVPQPRPAGPQPIAGAVVAAAQARAAAAASMGSAPAASVGSAPAASMGSAPAASMGSAPAASMGSAPAASMGSAPAASMGSAPAASMGSAPAASVGSAPAASVGSAPAASMGSAPAASVGSAPAASMGSAPAASMGSAPAPMSSASAVPVGAAPAAPSRPRIAMPALDIPVPRTTPVPPPVGGPPGITPEPSPAPAPAPATAKPE